MPKAEGPDYSQTLNLPRTDFPMKGDLPRREPEILAFWQALNLYGRLRDHQKGRPDTFVLHDGPPYANGNIHIGHALNKTLKDMVIKSRSLLGFQTPYIPGWDCHGLPIETALLKELKMGRKGVKDIPLFRKSAEDFAERFIALQRAEFIRLGVIGQWDKPYKTLTKEYESRVLRAFRLLLRDGYIYRGLRPVYWCPTCETALAEAEIEYQNKTSPSIFVAFPLLPGDISELKGAAALIWTTTPWTLPANKALAFHPQLEYVLVAVEREGEAPRRLLMAKSRVEAVMTAIKAARHEILGSWLGERLVRRNFKYESAYGGEGVGVPADYVSADDGTGIVHTAPGHGPDDFFTGKKFNLEILCPVDASGRFMKETGPLAGLAVLKEGNAAVLADLKARGLLLCEEKIEHSYPHCWRCKNPVIFRATEQWFLNIDEGGLRDKLLRAVNEVSWVPPEGKQRIETMVSHRPDWCISRQRVWGTPIPVLFCVRCGKPLLDDTVLEAIEKKVALEGDSFWFKDWGEIINRRTWNFLPVDLDCSCGAGEFRRETDILDVWVDSGASWLAVAPAGDNPVDVYLEGSDQHRGWFQSSLVLSLALTGRAPYKAVVTHGFVLDEKGRAMHKSAGNVVAPQTVIDKWGADVLRLWGALCDYKDDVRISDKLLEGPAESYRKLRNTFRYLLANTSDFDSRKDAVRYDDLPGLERYILHQLGELQIAVLEDYRGYQFRLAARRLIDFCAFDLSGFYLDILKDRLYTLPAADGARRAAQTVMGQCLERLLLLCAPILSFTAEEAWRHWSKNRRAEESVFLADLAAPDKRWRQADIAARWARMLTVRETVLKSLEEARAAKKIGSSLQAKITFVGSEEALNDIQKENWPEILLVSQVMFRSISGQNGGLAVEVSAADGAKCPRCWRYQTDIGLAAGHPLLCGRCARSLVA